MKEQPEVIKSNPDTGYYLRTDTGPHDIHFVVDGRSVGILHFEDNGTLSFEGNVDESAKIFFENVVKINNLKIHV